MTINNKIRNIGLAAVLAGAIGGGSCYIWQMQGLTEGKNLGKQASIELLKQQAKQSLDVSSLPFLEERLKKLNYELHNDLSTAIYLLQERPRAMYDNVAFQVEGSGLYRKEDYEQDDWKKVK